MLVGTDVCVGMVFVWEETGVPGGNPPVWLGDHMTISHADAGYQTRVAAVRASALMAWVHTYALCYRMMKVKWRRSFSRETQTVEWTM